MPDNHTGGGTKTLTGASGKLWEHPFKSIVVMVLVLLPFPKQHQIFFQPNHPFFGAPDQFFFGAPSKLFLRSRPI